MYLFHKLMGNDPRYRYWLKFFQIPTSRTPKQLQLVGLSKEQLTKFWRYSSWLQRVAMKTLFAQALFTMTLQAIGFAIRMQKYHYLHSAPVFWTILIVNSISLQAIGTMNFMITHSPIIYLFLNCKLLEERIVRTCRRLQKASFGSPSKVNRYLAHLGTIVDEVQRCNFFWSSVLAFNYHFAIWICSLVFLCGNFFSVHFWCFFFVVHFWCSSFWPEIIRRQASTSMSGELLNAQTISFQVSIRMTLCWPWRPAASSSWPTLEIWSSASGSAESCRLP